MVSNDDVVPTRRISPDTSGSRSSEFLRHSAPCTASHFRIRIDHVPIAIIYMRITSNGFTCESARLSKPHATSQPVQPTISREEMQGVRSKAHLAGHWSTGGVIQVSLAPPPSIKVLLSSSKRTEWKRMWRRSRYR